MNRKLTLGLIVGFLGIFLVVFFNATIKGTKANLVVSTQTVKVCGKNFTDFYLAQAPAGVSLIKEAIKVKGLSLAAYVPSSIQKNDTKLNLVAEVRGVASFPVLPDIPILPEKEQNKVCGLVQKYYNDFANKRSGLLGALRSNVFKLSSYGKSLTLGLQTGYQTAISNQTIQEESRVNNLKSLVTQQYTVARTRPAPTYDFMIIYQDGYESEADELIEFYSGRGIRTKATKLTQLPGYNPTGPVPSECAGEFLKECYHFWGDPAPGVSQLAVPSLPGYYSPTSAVQQYQKVSFIPGLIRAYVRAMKKNHPLRGVLLVGSSQKIPPFNTPIQHYYYDGHPYGENGSLPDMKVFTDLYYMLPDISLVQDESRMAQAIMNPSLWSCSGPNGVRLAYWCESNEWRHWPTPALSAYRNPAHVPTGKVYSLKYSMNHPYWATVGYDTVIPVGRIVTQDRFYGGKDNVVATYVEKLRRWYKELPAINNGSISSNGGSTNDTWIYTKEDIDEFQSTFGTNSKIYSSEFFVTSSKCAGRCVYQTAEQIMSVMGQKNISAFHLNGHGGHIAIQGPYANGNVHSTYLNEGASKSNDGLQYVGLFQHPNDSTIKQAELGGKLIGVIFANSCSPSDYRLDNQMSYLRKQRYPEANERSWAEQWIAMDDAGALNTFLNGDVGWGGSDNSYNVAFMKRVKTAHQSCGTLGDALRTLVLDGLRSGYSQGIGEWQLMNRHFLGSPLNHVARLPFHCNVIVNNPDLIENISRN